MGMICLPLYISVSVSVSLCCKIFSYSMLSQAKSVGRSEMTVDMKEEDGTRGMPGKKRGAFLSVDGDQFKGGKS